MLSRLRTPAMLRVAASSPAAPRAAVAFSTAPAEPERVYGGLADADRIFTNLYHEHDPYLKGALKRGDYYKCKELIQMGRDWIIDEVKKSGLRGRLASAHM